MIDAHIISDRTNLLAHHRIAAMVDSSPDILDKASRRVDETLAMTGGTSGKQLWQLVLRRPWRQVHKRMLDDGHEGRLLRSNSPFPFMVGPLGERERRQLWRQAKNELSAGTTSFARSRPSLGISTPSR